MGHTPIRNSINDATPEEWDSLKHNLGTLSRMVASLKDETILPTEVKKPVDVINPTYYKKGIETIEYIESKDMCYLEGNVVKYISRYKEKNGVEDLRKCAWYLEKLIERNVKGDKE